jgi:hypothetical protein
VSYSLRDWHFFKILKMFMLIYFIEDSFEILCHVDLNVWQHCCENLKLCELARLVDMIHTSFVFLQNA